METKSVSRGSKRKSEATAAFEIPDSPVCYCLEQRKVGRPEVLCNGCGMWFHQFCLKDLTNDDIGDMPFLMTYKFTCRKCSDGKEHWTLTYHIVHRHLVITSLANMTVLYMNVRMEAPNRHRAGTIFVPFDDIVEFMVKNWDQMSPNKARTKSEVEQIARNTLNKSASLFLPNPNGDDTFALNIALTDVSPAHEAAKQIYKDPKGVNITMGIEALTLGGPSPKTPAAKAPTKKTPAAKAPQKKTSAAKAPQNKTPVATTPKARPTTAPQKKAQKAPPKEPSVSEGAPPPKKAKLCRPPQPRQGLSNTRVIYLESNKIPPATLMGEIFYGLERDPNAPVTDYNNQEYRLICHPQVLLSQNDKDEDLKIGPDRLLVCGFEGHRIVRATHSVMKGAWYYEATVTNLPPESSVRIGWSREEAPLGSALGFTKYTYSWRSDKGTKFHDAKGKTYQPGGYKEGDVLGILIHLPFDATNPGEQSKYYLPPSRKNCYMVGNNFKSFKRVFDYQNPGAENEFLEFPGSKIEFFLNGVSCGVAFENIYRGLYYPAVSLYSAKFPPSVRFNFGPVLRHLPPGAQPMSLRAEELPAEQTLSDALFLVQTGVDGDIDEATDY